MKINPRKIKKHMIYTIKELSEALGVTKKTCFRWIEKGLKIVPGGKNPILIRGGDVKEFIRRKNLKRKFKMNRSQFNCLHCKGPVYAKRGSIRKMSGRKTALCRVCNRKIVRII
jgi:Helix-turn-helix domain